MRKYDPSLGAMPLGSHGKYQEKFFEVPEAVSVAARDGLRLRRRYGRGGTEVGEARAKQLSSGKPLVTLRDIVYIRSYFQRHAVDKLWMKDPPSNGWIAWQLWGGDAGRAWAESIYDREMSSSRRKVKRRSRSDGHDPFDPSGDALAVLEIAAANKDKIIETAAVTAVGLVVGSALGFVLRR